MNYENEYRLIYDAVEDIKHSEAWDDFELLRERVDLIISTFGPDGSRAKQAKLAEPVRYLSTERRKFQTILQLEKKEGGIFQASPKTLFKPMGLLLWGTDDKTVLLDLRVGAASQFINKPLQPIQARKFEASKTREELEELAKENKLAWPGEEYILTECDSAMEGNQITLYYRGALRDAALWGYGLK